MDSVRDRTWRLETSRQQRTVEGIEKSFYDVVDRQDYLNFWEEYERWLDQAAR